MNSDAQFWLALLGPSITVILAALALAMRTGSMANTISSVDNKVNGLDTKVERASTEMRAIGRDVAIVLERTQHHGDTLDRHEDRITTIERDGGASHRKG